MPCTGVHVGKTEVFESGDCLIELAKVVEKDAGSDGERWLGCAEERV
jgi:hypothetical protein